LILRTLNLDKYFGSLHAVDNVSLDIEEGEVRAIIGPNGAGKSTLLDLVSNRTRSSSGRVFFRDSEITGLAPHKIASKGIGRCFQVSKLFPGLSAFDNVQIACISRSDKTYDMLSSGNETHRDDVLRHLESVGLGGMVDDLAGYLSYGDQRRLEIAITLAMKPALLLLDEPTAGVSRAEGHDLMRLVKGLVADQSLTIIFIEHDMDMVFKYADRVSVMHLGRLMITDTPEEIRNNDLVRNIYWGDKAT
jgi:branched-chain amino acid transport system ATP-binding protein